MLIFRNSNRGLVKMLVVILIALLILAYFGLNLRSIVSSPTFQDNWSYITNGLAYIWNTFLKGAFEYLWNHIIVPIVAKNVSDATKAALTATSTMH